MPENLYSGFEDALRGKRWDDIRATVDGFAKRYEREVLVGVYRAGFEHVRRLCDSMPTEFPGFDSVTIARLSYALGLLSHYTRCDTTEELRAEDTFA